MSEHTPGPWDYVPSTEHHGPYVTSNYGVTICDCYVMSLPREWSTASGGPSKPIHHLHEMADPNARLIAAAPELYVLADHPVLDFLLGDGINLIPEPQRTSARTFLIPLRNAALAKARGQP